MTFEEKKNFVKNNVLNRIRLYVLGDLDVLDEIQPDKAGLRACAVPTAMLILSTIEFIGFLINVDGKLGNSEKNLEFAFKRYFPDIYEIKKENICRCI